MGRRAVAVAVSALGLMLALPAAARAEKPVCPSATLVTEPGVALHLPTPTCTNVTQITGFTVEDPPHGTFTMGNPNVYTPDAGFHGLDEFRYTVTDWFNGQSDPTPVRVIVDNDPVCTGLSVTVPANVPTVLPALPCTDADGDLIDTFIGDGAHGTTSISGNDVVYTPAAGYSGPDSLVFYAEDAFFASSDATLSITVSAPPPPLPTVVPTPPPAPKDTTAPAIALKNASKKQAVAIALTSNENASATLVLTLDKATAKKLKLSRSVGTLKAALTPGTSTLKVKLSSKAAKAFKKLKRVKVTLTAVVTDTAGNQTTRTLSITLKK